MSAGSASTEGRRIPPELLRSVPRPVEFTAAGKVVLVLAVALMVAAVASGVLLYLKAVSEAAWWKKAASEAIPSQGEVVRLGRTRNKEHKRVVTYQYEADGKFYQGRTVLSRRDRRPFRPGTSIEIVYPSSEPGTSWIPGYEPKMLPLWVVPIVPAGIILLCWLLVLSIRRQRRLLSEGRAAVARVIDSKRLRRDRSRNRVYYEFTALSGAVRRGHYDAGKRPPVKDSDFIVLYDKDEPGRQGRYPMSLVRIARL